MGLFGKETEESKSAKQEIKELKAKMKQEQEAERQAAIRAKQEQAQRIAAETAAVLITTGDLNTQYDVIDCIFAIDASTQGFFSGINPNDAFNGVKNVLRKRCYELGGQAVINCQFQYRNAIAGKKQVLEIFAYGTAVRLH